MQRLDDIGTSVDDLLKEYSGLNEIGVTGLERFGGYVQEDFLRALQLPNSLKIYKEMASNDPTVGAVLYMMEQLVRRVTWTIEEGGDEPQDIEARDFVDECKDDMSHTWLDFITEGLSMFTYGWSWHEIVYKRRMGSSNNPKHKSKYDDGKIGWRKLPGRSQDTWDSWDFDDEGGVKALIQVAPPDYQPRQIPIAKSILFRTRTNRGNPEGRSLLRNAYRPWYFKKKIEEIEAIGIERDLAGLPVLTTPAGVPIWAKDNPKARELREHLESLVRNVRRDQQEGLVLPPDFELKLLSSGGSRQIDTSKVINRYDQRIAVTLLADIVMLGADKVGSFALAEVKKSLLAASLEAMLKCMSEVINMYMIPRLIDLNGYEGLTDYPKAVPGDLEVPDLRELARYVQVLAGTEMPLFPDIDLENWLRKVAGMPIKPKQEEELEEPEEPEEEEEEGSEQLPLFEEGEQNASNGVFDEREPGV